MAALAESESAEAAALRQYYADTEYLSTPEGVMKLLAILGCLCSGVLLLAGGGCAGAGAGALGAASASVAFAGAGLLALQLTAALLGAPLHAPHLWLYTDVVGSTALGALLLLEGLLTLSLCELRAGISYVHAPLAVGNAALVVGGAAATYCAVTRRWDAARGPATEPRRAPPRDLDV